MHPTLVRHLVSPLVERALGRRTFALWREMRTIQWWPREKVRALQARKLTHLLTATARSCPHYRRLFKTIGIDPRIDEPFDILSRLPLLDKATIRRNLSDMTNHSVPGGPIPFNTGGSTGDPLVFHVDRRRIGCDKAARMLTHEWFGAGHGQREVYLWGSPIELRSQDHIKRMRDRVTNEMLLDAFNLSTKTMTQYIGRINAFNPTSIFGYPSSLTMLARFCESQGLPFAGTELRAVFVTGELLDDQQRTVLEGFFDRPVVNGYGSRDGGFIAHECPDGCMHVMDQNLIVEIIDEHGHPADCGVSGEIVITHLDALAMPLLRYQTGDIGVLLSDTCFCGRGLQVMGMVGGRRTDHLVAADGTLKHALSAIYVLRELASVARFHIRQRADLSVDVAIVPAEGFGSDEERRIAAGIAGQLGRGVSVRIHIVDSIMPEGSGKFRQVVSEAVGSPERLAPPNKEASAPEPTPVMACGGLP